MEDICNAVKTFIESKLPEVLPDFTDSRTPMPPPANIVFGVANVSRVDGKIICAVIPGTQTERNGSLTKGAKDSTLSIDFFCQKDRYDVLMRQMCRYAKALEMIIRSDWTLGGAVDDVEITETDFSPNAGATDFTATACEVNIIVHTSRSQPGSFDPFS